MFTLQFVLTVGIVASVSSDICTYSSWATSFDSAGQSYCKESVYFMKGFERSELRSWKEDPLFLFEGVVCCQMNLNWVPVERQVIYTDWSKVLDYNNAWALCPQGYFLQGMYRSGTGSPSFNGLYSIENGRCAKPTTHPSYYGSCYDEDTALCSDKKGQCLCREGFFVTGIYRSNDDKLFNLDKMRCCTMADKPRAIDNADELKDHIMDITLFKMANLADAMGYAYALGNRGLIPGEDFEKNGNTWDASRKFFLHPNRCEGAKCDQRLSLAFGDWSFAVKDIKYGQSVIDELKPETIDSGKIINNEPTSVTETFAISKTIQETITHTATSSWSNSHELGIEINFDLPFGIGSATASYKTTYEFSSSTTNEKSTSSLKTFTKTTSKTLQPNSAAKYNVIVYKSRITVPYTAVVIAKFSTEFRGVMKPGGSYGNWDYNYHSIYAGKSDMPTVNYKFGSSSVPFYTALRKESDTQAQPWQWNAIKANSFMARNYIDQLSDEGQYMFTLSGILSQVAGTKIDVIWEATNVVRREAPNENSMKIQISNQTVVAVPGPNDPVPKVEYPVVSLPLGIPVESKAIPDDKKST